MLAAVESQEDTASRNGEVFMIDRDEFLQFRVNNLLDKEKARYEKVNTGLGRVVLRQASRSSITMGQFASSKKEIAEGGASYFLESAVTDSPLRRQLWLPARRWVDSAGFGLAGTLPQREIVTTLAAPEARFAAWQDVQAKIYDLEDYSPYEGEPKALFEQAKLMLQFADANDDSFTFSVESE